MSSRLIFTVARGKPKFAEMALGLGRSLKLIGDETPRAVMTDLDGYDWSRYFDIVVAPPGPRSALDKLFALELTQFDQILSIDGDCLAFRRLGPAFEVFAGKPFAYIGHKRSSGMWHGAKVEEMCRRYGVESFPSFNGGVLYYERTDEYAKLLAEMRRVEANYGSTGFENFRGNASEEVCVALAMLETGIGEAVADETDIMNTAVGLVGKLRIDVMNNECQFVCRRHEMRTVRPYIFHASRYSNYLVYWRQLAKLEWLERYEDRHGFGHISVGHKLRRSVERRLIKLAGKV